MDVTAELRTPAQRLAAAARFDRTVYSEVAADGRTLAVLQSAGLVAAAGLARGIAAFTQEGAPGLIGGVVIGLLVWPLAAGAIHLVASVLGHRDGGFTELLRSLGFAALPLLMLVLAALPVAGLASIVWLGAHGLAIWAMVLCVREVLDLPLSRAALVCLLAVCLGWALLAILGWAMGGE